MELHYLKAMYNESDESVVEQWSENPYWQHFCGEQVFQHDLPCHLTSLVKWRKRVGIEAHHGNPYDGDTLKPAIAQVERLTAIKPQQVLVDQGFRGKEHYPEAIEVLVYGSCKPLSSLKRLLKRRSAIEPVVGRGKANHALGRNYLQGQLGDRLNALLVGCGFDTYLSLDRGRNNASKK